MQKNKVLVLDIETAPMTAYIWALKDQYIDINQIKTDWYVLAWGAKWLDDPESKFIYRDQRNSKNIENDKENLAVLKNLLDEADFIMTQNGKAFDWPKIRARFILNDISNPSFFSHIDIYRELKEIGFTSHSLGYLTDKLCKKYKKSSHSRFSGLKLWVECIKGNKEAWDELKAYNKLDVLSTEELYKITSKWLPKVVHKLSNPLAVCRKCGGKSFRSNGARPAKNSYIRKYCKTCGELFKEVIQCVDL